MVDLGFGKPHGTQDGADNGFMVESDSNIGAC
jgi:hypothetical protein